MTDLDLIVWALCLLTISMASFGLWAHFELRKITRTQRAILRELGIKDQEAS